MDDPSASMVSSYVDLDDSMVLAESCRFEQASAARYSFDDRTADSHDVYRYGNFISRVLQRPW